MSAKKEGATGGETCQVPAGSIPAWHLPWAGVVPSMCEILQETLIY